LNEGGDMRKERGQSILIIAGAIVGLLALFALVIDIGNYYAQQRIVKNAAEAGALGGALKLAQPNVTNQNVLLAVRDYVERNGLSWQNDRIEAYYLDQNGNILGLIPANNNPPPAEATGVLVKANKTTGTYFARIIGFESLIARAEAKASIVCGACEASNLFPIAVNDSVFDSTGGTPVFGYDYVIWDTGNPQAPGNFGWIRWRNQNPDEQTLVQNMADTTRSGNWSVGEWIDGTTGVTWGSGVRSELQKRIDGARPSSVTIIVYDQNRGQGANTQYRILSFARFKIKAYCKGKSGYPSSYDCTKFGSGDKVIIGTFEEWAEPSNLAGCTSYGVCAVKSGEGSPPPTANKNIVGTVAIQAVRLNESIQIVTTTQHIPVDVVLVIDVSGSMDDYWGQGASREKKITTAKRVLSTFVDYLQPDKGDRVALVSFPSMGTTSSYQLLCSEGGTWSNYYAVGKVEVGLTSNISLVKQKIQSLSANGGTPIAGGLSKANDILFNSSNRGTNVPVIILASDGIANFRINGQWTGFYGYSGQSSPPCNQPAIDDAINQANVSKMPANKGGVGGIVFSIAIGDNFQYDFLRAIASADTDPSKPHFFVAPGPQELEQIYRSIAERVQNIGTENCYVEEYPLPGEGATVVLYKNGQVYRTTTASATGAFQFTGVEPGTYQIAAWLEREGLRYDILTDSLGGNPLETLPTIEISDSPAYEVKNINLYLKNSTPLVCK